MAPEDGGWGGMILTLQGPRSPSPYTWGQDCASSVVSFPAPCLAQSFVRLSYAKAELYTEDCEAGR